MTPPKDQKLKQIIFFFLGLLLLVPPLLTISAQGHAADSANSGSNCPTSSSTSVSLSGEGGFPKVTLPYPQNWQHSQPSSGSMEFWPKHQPAKLIVSALKGRTLSDAEVRDMDRHAMGKFKELSPWKKEKGSKDRLFSSEYQTPQGTISARYYAGEGGLVFTTFETGGTLSPCTQSEYQRILRDLVVEFSAKNDKSSLKGESPCPASVQNAKESQGTCLDSSVLGQQRVSECGQYLEGKGWTRDPALEKTVLEKLKKPLACYRRP